MERITDGPRAQPLYRLREVKLPGKSAPEAGKYRAIVTRRGSYGTGMVVKETLETHHFGLPPYMVQSVVTSVIETMIKRTLEDGRTRRFGDYFAVRLDVRGTFDDKDAPFDPRRHEVKVSLVPLSRFRAAAQTSRPQNLVKPPRAHIDCVRSETAEPDCAKIGEKLIFTGRNLTILDDDSLVIEWSNHNLGRCSYTVLDFQLEENTPTRLVFKWNGMAGALAQLHSVYHDLRISIRSRGGKPNGTMRTVKYKNPVRIVD